MKRVRDELRAFATTLIASVLMLTGLAAVAPNAARADSVDRFVFVPIADAYVADDAPDTSYGALSYWWVDASPVRQSFLLFDLSNLSGRTIVDVRLRLYQLNSSPTGGRVFSMSSTSWTESVTWKTRPPIDGPQLGNFGKVSTNTWYEADLGEMDLADGLTSVAMDSPDSDGAKWSSRESLQPPQLIVEVETVPGVILDGLSQVANPYLGSSDPTYYPSNHHLAVTSAGRLLAVHGRHKTGVQLAWRDPGGGWQSTTTGAVTDGLLEPNPGSTGDWPASIGVARDSAGAEHAWVVWSGFSFAKTRAVQFRRLSDLDSSDGPTVGPLVTVRAAGQGNARVDLGFETAPDSSQKGAISYFRRAGSSAYQYVAVWFTDLDTDTPTFHDEAILFSSSDQNLTGSLSPTVNGMRLIARTGSGKVRLYAHNFTDPLGTWVLGSAGKATYDKARPSTVGLATGEVLATARSSSTLHDVKVIRFSPTGNTATVDLQLTGYTSPSIASDGTNAWLVMVRDTDTFIVSRQFTPGPGWSTSDQVEVGAEGGGGYTWPNTLRETDGQLRFIFGGMNFPGSTTQRVVLAYQRPL
jgi:hypothetical protein